MLGTDRRRLAHHFGFIRSDQAMAPGQTAADAETIFEGAGTTDVRVNASTDRTPDSSAPCWDGPRLERRGLRIAWFQAGRIKPPPTLERVNSPRLAVDRASSWTVATTGTLPAHCWPPCDQFALRLSGITGGVRTRRAPRFFFAWTRDRLLIVTRERGEPRRITLSGSWRRDPQVSPPPPTPSSSPPAATATSSSSTSGFDTPSRLTRHR